MKLISKREGANSTRVSSSSGQGPVSGDTVPNHCSLRAQLISPAYSRYPQPPPQVICVLCTGRGRNHGSYYCTLDTELFPAMCVFVNNQRYQWFH